MNTTMLWPIALIVLSNTAYHISAKSMPEEINPFASLIVTYLVGAVAAAVCYFVISPSDSIMDQVHHLNWTPFVLGLAIVGLEAGNIYMYKVGWNINTGYVVQSVMLSIVLLFVGFLLYKEAISITKVVGIAVCLLGVFLMTKG